MDNKMFCYQCQETKDNTGCTVAGVCGKTAKTANLQDMLVYQTKGLCDITDSLRIEEKKVERSVATEDEQGVEAGKQKNIICLAK